MKSKKKAILIPWKSILSDTENLNKVLSYSKTKSLDVFIVDKLNSEKAVLKKQKWHRSLMFFHFVRHDPQTKAHKKCLENRYKCPRLQATNVTPKNYPWLLLEATLDFGSPKETKKVSVGRFEDLAHHSLNIGCKNKSPRG